MNFKNINENELNRLLDGNKKNIFESYNNSYLFFNKEITKSNTNIQILPNIDVILPIDENSYCKSIQLDSFDEIDTINIFIGSELIESIDGEHIKILQKIYKINNNIPFGFFQKGILFGNTYNPIRIHIKNKNWDKNYNANIIKYTLVKSDSGVHRMKIYQYSKSKNSKPLKYIITKNNLRQLYLKFEINKETFQFKLIGNIVDKYLIFEFYEPIDTSICKNYWIVDELGKVIDKNIFFIYTNLLSKMSGMSGLYL
jgi:hypothetical protein